MSNCILAWSGHAGSSAGKLANPLQVAACRAVFWGEAPALASKRDMGQSAAPARPEKPEQAQEHEDGKDRAEQFFDRHEGMEFGVGKIGGGFVSPKANRSSRGMQ